MSSCHVIMLITHLLRSSDLTQGISVRSSVSREMLSSWLWAVTLDVAVKEKNGGPLATDIEECLCPPQYSGTSCEDCYQVNTNIRQIFLRDKNHLYYLYD